MLNDGLHRGSVDEPEAGEKGQFERLTRYRHIRDGALEALAICPRGNMALETALVAVWRVASRECVQKEVEAWLPGIV